MLKGKSMQKRYQIDFKRRDDDDLKSFDMIKKKREDVKNFDMLYMIFGKEMCHSFPRVIFSNLSCSFFVILYFCDVPK